MARLAPLLLCSLVAGVGRVVASPTIVQSLSSRCAAPAHPAARFALVLGGYGPGYTELKAVEVVRAGAVCPGLAQPLPPDTARSLGTPPPPPPPP